MYRLLLLLKYIIRNSHISSYNLIIGIKINVTTTKQQQKKKKEEGERHSYVGPANPAHGLPGPRLPFRRRASKGGTAPRAKMSSASSMLPFRVVYITSEMDHAPAIELQLAAYRDKSGIENAGGYQSGQFPDTPLELGLHVGTGSLYIDNVTFLVHRYEIPSKVEVFYGSYGASKET